MHLVSFILPIYQAEDFIYANLQRVIEYCSRMENPSEVIAVNDGSTDKTAELIDIFIKDNTSEVKIIHVNLKKNQGKGNAIRRGFEASSGSYIIFYDCDLPYSFENISEIIDKLDSNNADIVIACRMHEDSIYKIKSKNLSYIYIRHSSGRIFNRFINLLIPLNIKDTQAGLKGLRRDIAELVFRHMTVDGFCFDIDILTCAKDNNKKIMTVPVTFNYESEMSTINFIKQIYLMSYDLSKVYFKHITGSYRKPV